MSARGVIFGVLGGAGGLAVGIIIGLVVGVLIGPTATGLIVASSHQQLIDELSISEHIRANYDTGYQELTVKCADAGSKSWRAWPDLNVFTAGKSYLQSTWIWQGDGDTELCMTIWGPDDQGKFYVECGRTSCADFAIYRKGSLIASMPWGNGYLELSLDP